MSRRRGAQSGFTLLEVLVAMALFSLILSCFGVLFYRLGLTSSAIGRIERLETVDVVRRHLQHSLEGLRPYSLLAADGGRTMRFTGEARRVSFVGVSTGDREIGGLYETEVWLAPDGRLLQRRQPLGWKREGQIVPEVLLEGLASLTFSYVPCPHGAPGASIHRWTNARQLPFLITVRATFVPRDPREWLEVSAFIPAAACPIAK